MSLINKNWQTRSHLRNAFGFVGNVSPNMESSQGRQRELWTRVMGNAGPGAGEGPASGVSRILQTHSRTVGPPPMLFPPPFLTGGGVRVQGANPCEEVTFPSPGNSVRVSHRSGETLDHRGLEDERSLNDPAARGTCPRRHSCRPEGKTQPAFTTAHGVLQSLRSVSVCWVRRRPQALGVLGYTKQHSRLSHTRGRPCSPRSQHRRTTANKEARERRGNFGVTRSEFECCPPLTSPAPSGQ